MISSSLHMFFTKLAHQLSCTTCGLLWDIFLYYLWFCLGVKCADVLSVKNIMIIIIFIILKDVLQLENFFQIRTLNETFFNGKITKEQNGNQSKRNLLLIIYFSFFFMNNTHVRMCSVSQ